MAHLRCLEIKSSAAEYFCEFSMEVFQNNIGSALQENCGTKPTTSYLSSLSVQIDLATTGYKNGSTDCRVKFRTSSVSCF